eukprot:2061505-Pyramimonas_sp.AAC.1
MVGKRYVEHVTEDTLLGLTSKVSNDKIKQVISDEIMKQGKKAAAAAKKEAGKKDSSTARRQNSSPTQAVDPSEELNQDCMYGRIDCLITQCSEVFRMSSNEVDIIKGICLTAALEGQVTLAIQDGKPKVYKCWTSLRK